MVESHVTFNLKYINRTVTPWVFRLEVPRNKMLILGKRDSTRSRGHTTNIRTHILQLHIITKPLHHNTTFAHKLKMNTINGKIRSRCLVICCCCFFVVYIQIKTVCFPRIVGRRPYWIYLDHRLDRQM